MNEPMVLVEREAVYKPIVAAAWQGMQDLIPIAWAMAYHESYWRAHATRLVGSDGAMGGAWGLFQMTSDTAKSMLGFKGTPDMLLDPTTNAKLAYKLMCQNKEFLEQHRIVPTPEALVAAHNCGVGHIVHNTIPRSTSHDYVPTVMKIAQERYGFKPISSAPTESEASQPSPAAHTDKTTPEAPLSCNPDDA